MFNVRSRELCGHAANLVVCLRASPSHSVRKPACEFMRSPTGPGTLCAVATKQYIFLSDEWMAAARKIRDKHLSEATGVLNGVISGGMDPSAVSVRMNQIITDVPFGDGVVDAHIDSSSGSLSLDVGHLENPDVTVTVDYVTAKALFVDQDMSIAMQAFMSGKIRVDGDLAKLLALQAAGTQQLPDSVGNTAQQVAEALKAITAP